MTTDYAGRGSELGAEASEAPPSLSWDPLTSPRGEGASGRRWRRSEAPPPAHPGTMTSPRGGRANGGAVGWRAVGRGAHALRAGLPGVRGARPACRIRARLTPRAPRPARGSLPRAPAASRRWRPSGRRRLAPGFCSAGRPGAAPGRAGGAGFGELTAACTALPHAGPPARGAARSRPSPQPPLPPRSLRGQPCPRPDAVRAPRVGPPSCRRGVCAVRRPLAPPPPRPRRPLPGPSPSFRVLSPDPFPDPRLSATQSPRLTLRDSLPHHPGSFWCF